MASSCCVRPGVHRQATGGSSPCGSAGAAHPPQVRRSGCWLESVFCLLRFQRCSAPCHHPSPPPLGRELRGQRGAAGRAVPWCGRAGGARSQGSIPALVHSSASLGCGVRAMMRSRTMTSMTPDLILCALEPDRSILPGGVGEGGTFVYPRGSRIPEGTGRIVWRAEDVAAHCRSRACGIAPARSSRRGDACVAPPRFSGVH